MFLTKIKIAAALAVAGFLGAGVSVPALAHPRGQGDSRHGAVAADARTDAQRLQGTWALDWAIRDGKKGSAEKDRKLRMALTARGWRVERDGKLFREAGYAIDPGHDPKWWDSIGQGEYAGQVSRGIYKLEGNELTLCQPKPGGERPGNFESKPGSGIILSCWRRVDADADKADPSGTWKWTVDHGGQKREVAVRLTLEGDRLTGSMKSHPGQEMKVEDGTFKDGEVSFKVPGKTRDGQDVMRSYAGKLEGNTIKGTATIVHGGAKITGKWEARRAKE
jgi:uncharacterized protein (TIGR03067 family)